MPKSAKYLIAEHIAKEIRENPAYTVDVAVIGWWYHRIDIIKTTTSEKGRKYYKKLEINLYDNNIKIENSLLRDVTIPYEDPTLLQQIHQEIINL